MKIKSIIFIMATSASLIYEASSKMFWNLGSSVCVTITLMFGRPGSISGRNGTIFVFYIVSRAALGLTQTPTKWLPGVLCPEES
jgi:hypothetical protein